ncbi:hypothetical protein CHUAL_011155 [Chamberlinius hualienensis]
MLFIKNITSVLILLTIIGCIWSNPVENELPTNREKRITCDLLSGVPYVGGGPLCALHCKGHQHQTGYCDKGTCKCKD